ncbi:peptidase S41-like protein [Leeuwenhoekiella aestuarii]|uniref:S41 family peptidase n=1 Tax=Leeuwenhoekiella aestuarii TaxID=2249426 RepID=UPI000FFF66A3|nr:S41 family peptidase [Leeuwenhoekiella aestuarii]RXG12868.1 peptidase S41-like protein [Leeuwenhoekiella aestuarii]
MRLRSKFVLAPSFLLLSIITIHAQECTCAETFEEVVQVYEHDYALFPIKVTQTNKELYAANKEVFRQKAARVTAIEACLPILQQWLQFFRDGHTSISFTDNKAVKETRKSIVMDKSAFLKEVNNIKKKKTFQNTDLLGIWKYGAYEVGILPQKNAPNQFTGVILSSTNKLWKPGDVKFELSQVYGNAYEAVYYMDDNSGRKLKVNLQNPEHLEFINYNKWVKVGPANPNTITDTAQTERYSDFHIRMIDGKIPYIRFPNFYEKEPAFVDSLIRAHHQELVEAAFFIVDVRDNNGGNDAVYKPLFPYILSGPIQTPNYGIWISEGNINMFLNGRKPEELEAESKAEYDYLSSLKGTVFWPDGAAYASTSVPDTLFAPHQKVAVLINEKTISSGETFVYRTRQSEKVILYGQNTAGIIDGFNVLTKTINCFKLHYPSSIRARDVAENPIDPYGMPPDVYVDKNLDVLKFAIEHMSLLNHKKQ